VRWDAWYSDYGAEANVELYSTRAKDRTLTLVFLHGTLGNGPADRDERYILANLRRD
jgi:hypothetical protein